MIKNIFFTLSFLFCVFGFAQHSPNTKADDGILIVYPNPAKDFILLKSKNPAVKIKSVAFYSILGVQVADYPINSSTSELRLDKLQSGKYLLRYTLTDNTQKVVQMVKQ